MRRAWLPLVMLVLGACGGRAVDPGAAPSPTSAVSGTNGPFYAEVAPAQLAAGGTVRLTLTVTGPIDYEIGCVQTLHIWAEDSRHRQVWEEPVPEIMCMALGHKVLAAGATASFIADWPTWEPLSISR